MRPCFVVSVFALMLGWPTTGSFARAEQQRSTPYTAHVVAADVYVRSGPGKNYYPTAKLQKGDAVEVYRHDPGGWYAIRPVEGSFTWVSGRYLKVEENGLGRVTADRVAARVGSQFSDIRDVIQFRLHRGETVEVLGKKEFPGSTSGGTWYKIAPPSGEFRWIAGKYVDADYLTSGVRDSASAAAGLIGREIATSEAPRADFVRQADPIAANAEAGPSEPRLLRTVLGQAADFSDPSPLEPRAIASTSAASQVEPADHWAPTSDRQEPSSVQPASAAAPPEAPRTADGSLLTHRSGAFPELDPENAQAPRGRPVSGEAFQAELDDVNLDLSIMLAEEPTVWEFQELSFRAERLSARAATAVQRGHARLLSSKIERSKDLARRYSAVAALRVETERRNGRLARVGSLVGSRPPGFAARAVSVDESRYDATGRLGRIMSPAMGEPRFALADDEGRITCYVTAAPGVKLDHYVSRRIGITGIRGRYAKQDALLVTAKHVSALR